MQHTQNIYSFCVCFVLFCFIVTPSFVSVLFWFLSHTFCTFSVLCYACFVYVFVYKVNKRCSFSIGNTIPPFFPNILMQNNCVLFWFHRCMYFYFTGKLYSRTHASNVQILKLYIDVSTLFLWKHYHSTSVKWVICQHGFVTMQ